MGGTDRLAIILNHAGFTGIASRCVELQELAGLSSPQQLIFLKNFKVFFTGYACSF